MTMYTMQTNKIVTQLQSLLGDTQTKQSHNYTLYCNKSSLLGDTQTKQSHNYVFYYNKTSLLGDTQTKQSHNYMLYCKKKQKNSDTITRLLQHTEFYPNQLWSLWKMGTEVFDFLHNCALEWKSRSSKLVSKCRVIITPSLKEIGL